MFGSVRLPPDPSGKSLTYDNYESTSKAPSKPTPSSPNSSAKDPSERYNLIMEQAGEADDLDV